jgi:hypothetical protein
MTVNVKNTQRYKNTKALPSFPNIIATKWLGTRMQNMTVTYHATSFWFQLCTFVWTLISFFFICLSYANHILRNIIICRKRVLRFQTVSVRCNWIWLPQGIWIWLVTHHMLWVYEFMFSTRVCVCVCVCVCARARAWVWTGCDDNICA